MQTSDDPIALVGFSLKFPQDADSTEGFWQMLSEGKNASTDFPPTKFNIDAFEGRKGAMNGTVRAFFPDRLCGRSCLTAACRCHYEEVTF